MYAGAARELTPRRVSLCQVSGTLDPVAGLEEVGGQIGPADVDREAVDDARAWHHGAAGLPEHAELTGAWLGLTLSGEPELAVTGFDLAHASSVGPGRGADIRGRSESRCGVLLRPDPHSVRRRSVTAPRLSAKRVTPTTTATSRAPKAPSVPRRVTRSSAS